MENPMKGIMDEVIEDLFSKGEEELLEIKILYDARDNIGVGVYPDKGRVGAYFKVFNGPNPENSSLLARIAFKYPYYEHHYEDSSQVPRGKRDVKGKQSNWYLNSKEKQKLIEILDRMNKKNPQVTVWRALILAFNEASKVRLQSKDVKEEDIFLDPGLTRPDYMELPSSREENDRKKAEYEAAIRRLKGRR